MTSHRVTVCFLASAVFLGASASADAALMTLIEKHGGVTSFQIAQVYALRNDTKATFDWLDRVGAPATRECRRFFTTPSSIASRKILDSLLFAARSACGAANSVEGPVLYSTNVT
jgi:hypothetical protein